LLREGSFSNKKQNTGTRNRKGNTMKTQIRNSVHFIAMVAVLAFASHTVLGDDLNPPSYRGDPLSVFSEWQLVPGSLILNQTQWNTVGLAPWILSPVPVSTQVLPDPASAIYDFQLPNWKDNMPIKYMRVQLSWENAPASPVNVFSQAIFANNSITGAIAFASTPTLNASGTGWYQYFDLTFQPNPEWERVQVTLPSGGYLTQAVIDTVSTVPEPATIAMLSLGGLVLRLRRRA
jgi:hypothetical protein